jgi:stress response protein YsnF
MAICAYQLWKETREKLPESYFEEADEEQDMYDVHVTRYQKYTRSAKKLLGDAHQTYLRDVELLKIYMEFLELTKDEDTKALAIVKALDAFKNDPDYYLLL